MRESEPQQNITQREKIIDLEKFDKMVCNYVKNTFCLSKGEKAETIEEIGELVRMCITEREVTAQSAPAAQERIDALVKRQKLRMRQLFFNDSKCELCEKVMPEDGYDGQNEGCEKGLCIDCAIDKSLHEFAIALLQAGKK